MANRRRLPAPPLVLTPTFGRYRVDSTSATFLMDLARYLQGRNLLTDGGVKNLEKGLKGRNFVVSLGLQDVRSYAHGLVQDLMDRPSEEWKACTQEYFQSYDKGKPRRPTHLQRLYLDWSRDLSWPGLLQACRNHPTLWSELKLALDRLDDESRDSTILNLALHCRERLDPWESAFKNPQSQKEDLLRLLPLLTQADRLAWRLEWLAQTACSCSGDEPWATALIAACHCDFPQARRLRSHNFSRDSLERVALNCLDQEEFDPLFVSAFRSFVLSSRTIETLFAAISPEDPLQRVVYGARPGTSWLMAQKSEMYRLCAETPALE